MFGCLEPVIIIKLLLTTLVESQCFINSLASQALADKQTAKVGLSRPTDSMYKLAQNCSNCRHTLAHSSPVGDVITKPTSSSLAYLDESEPHFCKEFWARN